MKSLAELNTLADAINNPIFDSPNSNIRIDLENEHDVENLMKIRLQMDKKNSFYVDFNGVVYLLTNSKKLIGYNENNIGTFFDAHEIEILKRFLFYNEEWILTL